MFRGRKNKAVYIFDLDGTLALNEHRQHLVQCDEPDWDAFFEACDGDQPNIPVMRTLKRLRDTGAEIWIWSGRSRSVLHKTVNWLMLFGLADSPSIGYSPRKLRMRPDGDCTPDDHLKRSWYESLSDEEKESVVAVFDDRNKVVDMWRSLGIPCFQVAEGDF